MKTLFLHGLDKEDTEEMEASFIASRVMRKKLNKILSSKVAHTHAWQSSKNSYGEPNWALQQADAMGYIRALEEVMSLMTLAKREAKEPRGRGRPKGALGKPIPINEM